MISCLFWCIFLKKLGKNSLTLVPQLIFSMVKKSIFIYAFLHTLLSVAEKAPANQQPVYFTENKGQVSDQYFKPRPDVLFGGRTGDMNFHLRTNGISYQLYKSETVSRTSSKPESKFDKPVPQKLSIYRLDVEWMNCNPSPQISTGEVLEGYSNYYLEVCPQGATQVKSYKAVTYQTIYNGIDLKWYEKENALKYDFVVKPGAVYNQIQLKIKGADKLEINSKGELVISTPYGTIAEEAPVVIQNGKQLPAKWKLNGNVISFSIENINAAESFVIDPAIRVWGTYFGGSGTDQGQSTTKGPNGKIYMGGQTSTGSSTMVATVGAHQTFYGGGLCDAYICQFNTAGARQWSTYFGGSGEENGPNCATDNSGNVYMAGFTSSNTTTIIATPGAHQTTFGSGGFDAYLVKFNSAGLRQWSTYYGGNNDDAGTSCTTDAAGNVYLSGYSASSGGTVIASPGSHQPISGGGYEGFLVQFNTSGVRQWATYYGGTGNDYAYGLACKGGTLYMSGYTDTNGGTAIATPGSHQPAYVGVSDAFLVKFNTSGIRQWATYYGGANEEQANSCAIDTEDNIYMSGYTTSSTNIAIDGAHQADYAGGGNYDAYIVKFNPGGLRLWSTYYGGSGNDYGFCCTTDSLDNVFLAGYTSSNTGTIMATADGNQPAYGGGNNDAYLVQFNSLGIRQWATYYGGTLNENGYACTSGLGSHVYLAGNTNSPGGTDIATPGSYQDTYASGIYDAYLVKIFDCAIPSAPTNVTPVSNLTLCAGNSTTLYATGSGTVSWYATPSSPTPITSGTTLVTSTLSTGTYTYYTAAANNCSNSPVRSAITITVESCIPTGIKERTNSYAVNVYPNPNSGDFTVCSSADIFLSLVTETGVIVDKIALTGSNNHTWHLKNLSAGIYFITGTGETYPYAKKIVVIR